VHDILLDAAKGLLVADEFYDEKHYEEICE
jgi:hypothetical protein